MKSPGPFDIAAAAHDLKNVLLLLQLNAALLPPECRASAPDAFEEIGYALARANDLARQLLEQARASMTRDSAPATEPTDLAALLPAMVERYARILPPEIQVHLDVAASELFVAASRGFFERMLLELLLNARDAMPAGGLVSVRAEASAGEVRLIIRDTGTGMDEAVRARLFQPFFTTKGERGSGLGLYAIWTDVTSLGGRIAVVSEPGEGTSFIVALPAGVAAPRR